MIGLSSETQVWLASGATDMRRGFDGLALLVQEMLKRDPHCGHLFVFRGKRGGLVKILWHDGQGMCLFAKRLDRGRFVWPRTEGEAVTITPAQLGYLLEGTRVAAHLCATEFKFAFKRNCLDKRSPKGGLHRMRPSKRKHENRKFGRAPRRAKVRPAYRPRASRTTNFATLMSSAE